MRRKNSVRDHSHNRGGALHHAQQEADVALGQILWRDLQLFEVGEHHQGTCELCVQENLKQHSADYSHDRVIDVHRLNREALEVQSIEAEVDRDHHLKDEDEDALP